MFDTCCCCCCCCCWDTTFSFLAVDLVGVFRREDNKRARRRFAVASSLVVSLFFFRTRVEADEKDIDVDVPGVGEEDGEVLEVPFGLDFRCRLGN